MGPLGPIYTMDEAAASLRMSRRAFSQLVKKHPHYHRNGHKKLFDVADLEALWAAMRAENQPVRAEKVIIKALPSDERAYADLRRILAKKAKEKAEAKAERAARSKAARKASDRARADEKVPKR